MTHVQDIDYRDPLDLFARVVRRPFAQLLHSAPGAAGGGRYSFIVLEPFDVATAKNGQCRTLRGGGRPGAPFELLRAFLAEFPRRDAMAQTGFPLAGGLVGYLGYELARGLERITPAVEDDLNLPDMILGAYDVVAAFDHELQRAAILSTGLPETDPAKAAARARRRADEILALLRQAAPPEARSSEPVTLAPRWPAARYREAVARVVEYIKAGDMFQANLTQRFEGELDAGFDPYALFRRLARRNPVSYAAYLNLPQAVIVSNSPEQFLKLERARDGWTVRTRPIKGTIARGDTPDTDERRAARLRASEKDRAENIMIVDLLRNDLSRVCADDSVEVDRLCGSETYAHIHHLVSTVTGRLQPGLTAVDVLKACFPGGSITGAPKVRAMEVIAELEGRVRGPYCGAIGYLGFDGAMDTSIAIRTFVLARQAAGGFHGILSVGGGITVDSDPAREYQECLDKAAPFFEALAEPPERT